MVFTTQFTELVSSFRSVDAQLREAIRTDEHTRTHARLLRRSAELLDRIETYQPTCREELEEIADHYARRRVEGAAIGARAAARFADALRRSGGESLPSRAYSTTRGTTVPDPLPAQIEGEDLAQLIVHCRGRLSAIGRDSRFIAVSSAEAAESRMRPSQVLGCRLHDLVECGAVQTRECRALALALGGRPQCHTLREDGAAFRRVCLSGVVDGAGRLYAVIRHVEPVQISPGTT
ncbi:hypothetical protein [Palleronia sp.]|uniref:hypothetical protein n=1 Tax=Palleronia sp. TaxID=1940284 RepID=UPI0035C841B0